MYKFLFSLHKAHSPISSVRDDEVGHRERSPVWVHRQHTPVFPQCIHPCAQSLTRHVQMSARLDETTTSKVRRKHCCELWQVAVLELFNLCVAPKGPCGPRALGFSNFRVACHPCLSESLAFAAIAGFTAQGGLERAVVLHSAGKASMTLSMPRS